MYYNQTIYIPKAIGVKEYAYDEEINIPYRKTMEDFYFINDNILEDGSQSILFGIMDGHGGIGVAKFVSINFPKVFQQLWKQKQRPIDQLLNDTFQKINEQVREQCDSREMGCTASIGFMRLEGAKRILYFANVGDSKAFLFGDSIIPLTTDHKPNKDEERKRIQSFKGTVIMERLNGILAISRAIGDHSFSQYGLISQPSQIKVDIRLSQKWIVVASDGLWDVITQEELLQFIKYKESADEVTKFLTKTAVKRISKDNISVLCLKIQKQIIINQHNLEPQSFKVIEFLVDKNAYNRTKELSQQKLRHSNFECIGALLEEIFNYSTNIQNIKLNLEVLINTRNIKESLIMKNVYKNILAQEYLILQNQNYY